MVSEIQKEAESIILQNLETLLENSESLMKSSKETYAHQLKVSKEELHCKTKLLIRYWKLLKNLGVTNSIPSQLPCQFWKWFDNILKYSYW